MKRRVVRTVLLILWVPLTACLTYKSIGNVMPVRGAEVVATVAPLEARVGEITIHRVTNVQGRVTFADGDSIVVAGTRFTSEAGTPYQSIGDLLTIPRADIVELKQKRVSGWKTAIALGASGAAVAAILAAVGPLSGFGSGGGPGKPPP